MKGLRSAVTEEGTTAPGAALDHLDALERCVQRLLSEHGGMAEELLQVYEQLGIVFEVTRQLPNMQDEQDVLRLFAETLRPTYPQAKVAVIDSEIAVDAFGHQDTGDQGWIREATQQCRHQHRVVVACCPDGEFSAERHGCSKCALQDTCNGPFGQVMCGPIYAGDTFIGTLLLGHRPAQFQDPSQDGFNASDMLLLESLVSYCGDLIRNFRLMDELRQLSVDMVGALINAIEQKDEYTSGHTTRVAIYAVMLGREVGLDAVAIQLLEWSALLHDVGKIGIRDEVLKKPGRLTDDEFKHIQEHPVRSYEVVRVVPQLTDALDGVLHHHEHWDGSGYPAGLAGEDIPLQARIIQVADIFDALTSTRPYRKAFTWEKALDVLRSESGQTVDPTLAAQFDKMIVRMAREDPERLHQTMSIQRQRAADSSARGDD
ncbi:MAG: HD-GYP domain-containing protein [Phycisphaerae bacterium]